MPDQAAGLRSLFARRRPSLLIVAGSDACKASVAVHFAREAAAANRATVLIDGTAGQVASACDIACRYELSHVLAGDKPASDVLRALTPYLLMLPAARALSRFGTFTADEEARLSDAFSTGIAQAFVQAGAQDVQVDLIVVHAEEGQAGRAVDAFGRDARVIVVASDREHSLRGAYLEMRGLAQDQNLEHFEIVSPRFDETTPTGVAFANLANAARRFLDIELKDGGTVLLPLPAGTPTATRTLPSAFTPTSSPASTDEASSTHPLSPSPSPSHEVTHAAAVA